MIKNNNFYIENLKTVVLIGYSKSYSKIIKFNNTINLDTHIIVDPHQSKLLNKKTNYQIFGKLDNKFKKYIVKNMKIKNTIFISLGARYIFKKQEIEKFFLNNLINFHGTRLPLDAGGGGFSWKILREDRIDNQLIHLIDEGLDTGPIIDSCTSLFPKHCKIPIDFENYSLEKFNNFYSRFINKVLNRKKFKLKPQIDYLGRYNPRLNTEIDGFIDWEMKSYDLYNFINAFDEPYRGASTYINNGKFGKLYIKKVHIHGGESPNHPYMSGIVSRHDKDWIVVSTKSKHMLLIEEVINNKGKNIIKDIKTGDRFFTPLKKLEDSKKNRTTYNSFGLKNK